MHINAAMANPVGSPFGNPVQGMSPELMAWLRQQAMEQNMSMQARAAIANRLGQQQASLVPPTGEEAPLATTVGPATPAFGVDPTMGAPPTQELPLAPPPIQPMATPQGPSSGPSQPAPFAAMPPTASPGGGSVVRDAQGQPVNTAGGPLRANPMAAAGAQLPPEIAPGPATTPEEQTKRISGWKQIVEKLKSDPKLQLMLLKLGTQMMQPVQPGQTAAGHVGQALGGSVDYLQAQQAAETQQELQRAQTAEVTARTATEAQRPAGVAATTGLTEAQIGRTVAETGTEDALRKGLVEEAQQKIKLMKSQGGLADEQAREYATTLQRNPKYAAAVIKELEARAWQHKNPGASQREASRARLDFIASLAPIIQKVDPELQALSKTDPELAIAKAKLQASDRWFASGATAAAQGETAAGNLEYLRAQYDYEVTTGSKNVKGKSFEIWAGEEIMSLVNPMDKAIKAQMLKQLGKKGTMQTPSGAGGRSTEDPLGIRK